MAITLDKTYIYHITPIENLESIVKCKGLYCKNKQPKGCRNIAYADIQLKRASITAPLFPGGILHDYVPFYFAPRSPMLYALHTGSVSDFSDGQEKIIHIVSSILKVEGCQLKYVFTDGHAIMNLTDFYNDLSDMDKIDWEIMRETFWADTPEDGDRKRRRQAEFLIHKFFPLEAISGIGVINQEIKIEVNEILSRYNVEVPIKVIPQWYY